MTQINYYDLSDYIKERNKERKAKGENPFNLSMFRRSNRFYNIIKMHYASKGLDAEIVTTGRTGKTMVCKELFLLAKVYENPQKITRILSGK